jgi:8-oxo-dGTP pyrophosphatase MutT (NUDIX family)
VSLSPLQQLLALRLHSRTPATVSDSEIREASVALIVGSEPDAILIIRRAERSGDPWSGHMGLPGGRRDAKDEHLLATAMRETWEEVGIQLTSHALLGSLDDVAPRSRSQLPVFARPFVFGVRGHPSLVPNTEVSAARWVPLEELTNPANLRDFTIEVGGVSRTFPAYHVEEGTIWGMTERMLTSLLEIIREPVESGLE